MLPLFLLFVILPIAEIMLLINVSATIGGWNTFFVVIVTAFFGAYFVRQQGFALFQQLQNKISNGEAPSTEMAEGILLLVAGVLLITPGFITDILGFLFTLPFSRAPIAKFLMSKMLARQSGAGFQFNFSSRQSHYDNRQQQNTQSGFESDKNPNGETIEGEFVDKTEKDDKNRLN